MRLIDAEVFLDYIDNLLIKTHTSNIGVIALYKLVDMQETVDAVQVVRCKDCKYYDFPFEVDGMRFEGECAFHDWYRADPKENDYCSRGERKDDENMR